MRVERLSCPCAAHLYGRHLCRGATISQWTPGDVWTAVLRLPVNTEVQYKYIRRSDKGHVVAWEGSEQGA